MGNRLPYDPYEVTGQTSQHLQLQLSASQQIFYRIVTRVLPVVITLLLAGLFLHLKQEGETQKLVWVLVAMAAPLMLLFIPSWPSICIRRGMIEVRRHQGFQTSTLSFKVVAGSRFEARLNFMHKSAHYNFYLIDPQGHRQKLFEIPTPPFSLRKREKDRMLEALHRYSLPAEPGTV